MSDVSAKQIYDLLTDISRKLTNIEDSVDELLCSARVFNRQLLSDQRYFSELSRLLPKASTR